MNFWDVHGVLFLFFAVLFPRLTMLFATVVPFGVLAWLGWFFLPRFTMAIFAIMYYGSTNPLLVFFSIILSCLDIGEKSIIVKYK